MCLDNPSPVRKLKKNRIFYKVVLDGTSPYARPTKWKIFDNEPLTYEKGTYLHSPMWVRTRGPFHYPENMDLYAGLTHGIYLFTSPEAALNWFPFLIKSPGILGHRLLECFVPKGTTYRQSRQGYGTEVVVEELFVVGGYKWPPPQPIL